MARELDKIELGFLIALVLHAVKKRWKWALASVLLINAVAVLVLFFVPPVYRAESIIEPGIVGVNPDGQPILADTASNLVERISSAPLQNRTMTRVRQSLGESPKLQFKTYILGEPTQTRNRPYYSIHVSCDAPNPSLGLAALSSLIAELEAELRPTMDKTKSQLGDQLASKRQELETARQDLDSYITQNQQRIQWYDEQIADLQAQQSRIASAIERIRRELETALSEKAAESRPGRAEGNPSELPELQEQETSVNLRIQEYRKIVDDSAAERDLRLLPNAQSLELEVASLQSLCDLVQPLKVVKSPALSPKPIRPNRWQTSLAVLIVSVLLVTAAVGMWEIARQGRAARP